VAFGPGSSKVAVSLAERFPEHLKSFILLPATAPAIGSDATHLTDDGGHAHRDYAIDGDTLLVIRPDGHVGMRAAEPDETEVLQYLSRFLPGKQAGNPLT
jgi:hypothetical protein